MLGLGNIGQKVQDIIRKLRQPVEKAVDWVINQGVKFAKTLDNKFKQSKVGKKVQSAKETARKKKEAAQKFINKKKEAVEKRYQQEKNKLLKSKAGKKQLDALKKKRDAAKNKLEKAKNWPAKKLEAFMGRKDKKQRGFGKDEAGNKIAKDNKEKQRKQQEQQKHEQKVKAGLAAIDKEETRYLKQGKIAREDAEKVASTVKRQYPVFKVLMVIDGGERWDYDYVASPGRKKQGEKKRKRISITKKRFQKFSIDSTKVTIRKKNTLKIIGKAHQSFILRQNTLTKVEPKNKADKVNFLRHLSTVINSSSKNFQEVQAAIKGDLIYISSNSKETELPKTKDEILKIATVKDDDNQRVKRHKNKLKEELQKAFASHKYEVVAGLQGQHAETKIITKDKDIEHIAGQRRPCAACFIFFILKGVPPEKFNPHPGPLWEANNALKSIFEQFIFPHLNDKFPKGAENEQEVQKQITQWLEDNEGKFDIGDTGYVNKDISAANETGYDTPSEDESM